MLSELFYITLMSGCFAFLTLSVRYCLKCRISEINCCGLKIKRDTVLENEEAEMRIEHNITDSNKTNNEFVPNKV